MSRRLPDRDATVLAALAASPAVPAASARRAGEPPRPSEKEERNGRRISSYESISPLETPDWDARIRRYATKGLFHEQAWLRFLARSQGARIHGLRLVDGRGGELGYFCAAEVQRTIFRLLGSPLQGWTTNFMGPAVDQLHTESFLEVVEEYCRGRRVHYVELAGPALSGRAELRRAGYELDLDSTFAVKIDDEPAMWRRLQDKSCRYCIRRARRNGLRVERTSDPACVEQYWRRLEDTLLRQGLVDPHGIQRVQALWDCLMPAGRLLALRVWSGDELLATGLFPFDERGIYFWGAASWVRAYALYPNEFLQWHVMLFALEKGIPEYHMWSGAHYKKKFGGELRPVERWFKAFSPLARVGRAALKRYVEAKRRGLGRLKRTLYGHRGRRDAAS